MLINNSWATISTSVVSFWYQELKHQLVCGQAGFSIRPTLTLSIFLANYMLWKPQVQWGLYTNQNYMWDQILSFMFFRIFQHITPRLGSSSKSRKQSILARSLFSLFPQVTSIQTKTTGRNRAVHRGSNPSIFDGPRENWGPQRGPKETLRGPQRSAECKNAGKREKKKKERQKD